MLRTAGTSPPIHTNQRETMQYQRRLVNRSEVPAAHVIKSGLDRPGERFRLSGTFAWNNMSR